VYIERSSLMNDQMCFEVASGFSAKSVCVAVDTVWNHFALAWDNSGATATLQIFKNGILVETLQDLPLNTAVEAHYLTLPGSDKLSLCDDLRIYKRILSAEEVEVLGEGGGPNSIEEHNAVVPIASAYPSPATDYISIDVEDLTSTVDVRVMDQLGHEVLRSNDPSAISISALGNGAYAAFVYSSGVVIAKSVFVVMR
jgi:hypothetical protein